MRSRPACRRRGFTLIEMLLVIGILIILITLAALFLPNLDRNKGVPNAVTQVEGWIRLSKNQALRDGAPRGIRLIQDLQNDPTGRTVVRLQYIEQPDPVAPRAPGLTLTLQTQIGAQVICTATLNAGDTWDQRGVQANDYLELTGGPVAVARIQAVNGLTLILDRVIDGTEPLSVTPPITGNTITMSDGFRVIRSPRPLAGEPLLELHKDVWIDLANCYPVPQFPPPPLPQSIAPDNPGTFVAPWSLSGNLDILFNSSGYVANATTGQLILAVRHKERLNDMLFVVVYTRSGKVTAVPPFDAPNQDLYGFARDGRSPGL